MTDIQIKETELSLSECADFVKTPKAGGTAVFIGTVRNMTANKRVISLEFESYIPMAIKELSKIAEKAKQKWEVMALSIHHRVGKLEVGEVPVIIAVATAHRKEAFEACQYCIDTLKETVPIWKKEVFEGGEEWVSAHP